LRATARVAAIILAAGRSTRMGAQNKLLAEVSGEAMVRRVVKATLASRARPVLVVTGHGRDEVRAALAGLAVTLVDNPDYAAGLRCSL
jgi:molybdenum cofactor cytidylyltransferase